MIKSKRLFLLEFNELCPTLLADFMRRGVLPNFQRLHDTSVIYTTDADEEAPHLEPWIQWLSVHSGLRYGEHGAYHLGDGRNFSEKCLAEILSDAGIRVGVFGSMNTNYANLNGYYIPDAWEAKARPQPESLAPFFDTVARQVQESSQNGGLTKGVLAHFAAFMMTHGLTWQTIKAGIAQLAAERKDPGVSWRRASLLEKIQYDLFKYLDRKFRPQFATFFANSTAHYQHYYWRNMHPEIFEMPPDQNDHPSLQFAIQYGYEQMDEIIGRFLDDYPDVTLVLCTALSQQPWTETTKCTFRPRKFESLLNLAGISVKAARVEPVMAEEFRVTFPDQSLAETGAEALASLSIDGDPLMKLELKGTSVFTGCAVYDARAMQGDVEGAQGKRAKFRDLFHMVHSVRSGRHHPDGVLWIRDGRHAVVDEKVALIDIAPTVLRRFGVPIPPRMTGGSLEAAQESRQLAPATSD